MSIGNLCAQVNNFFVKKKYFGTFKIFNGSISPFDVQKNQYFRILGSVFNDGVYQNNEINLFALKNETYDGAIWELAIPPDFVALYEDINKYNAKIDEMAAAQKGYISESFGGYSYSLASSAPAGMEEWKSRIDKQLARWRKL